MWPTYSGYFKWSEYPIELYHNVTSGPCPGLLGIKNFIFKTIQCIKIFAVQEKSLKLVSAMIPSAPIYTLEPVSWQIKAQLRKLKDQIIPIEHFGNLLIFYKVHMMLEFTRCYMVKSLKIALLKLYASNLKTFQLK